MAGYETTFDHFTSALLRTVRASAEEFSFVNYPSLYAQSFLSEHGGKVLPEELKPAEMLKLKTDSDSEELPAFLWVDSVQLEDIVVGWAARTGQTAEEIVCALADAYCALTGIKLPEGRREHERVAQYVASLPSTV